MDKRVTIFRKILLCTLFISIVVFVVSYIKRDNLPEQDKILSSLLLDPVQNEINLESFEIKKGGYTYNVEPKYSYELLGLIVAEYDSETWYDFAHKSDPLNTKDLCVIWGGNTSNGVYQQMKFSHGEWTCWAEFKSNVDSSWYEKFNSSQLSNNHLLPTNDEIYKAVKNTNIGNQIRLKGYLVDYSVNTPEGKTGTRETSTVREDTGCEVIYVTEFEILREETKEFRLMNTISKYTTLILVVILIVSLFL